MRLKCLTVVNQQSMQYNHSHHNTLADNYEYHVFRIGTNDFCIGCTATRSFIALGLPLILIFVGLLWSQLSIHFFPSLLLWYLMIITIYVYEYYTGGHVHRIISSIVQYTFVGHLFYNMIYINLSEYNNNSWILGVIIVLIGPQYILSIRKAFSRREFTYKKLKFVIRESFLIGNFILFLLIPKNNPVQVFTSFFIVLANVTVFLVLRSYSDKLIIEDFQLVDGDSFNLYKSSSEKESLSSPQERYKNPFRTAKIIDNGYHSKEKAKKREREFRKMYDPPSKKDDAFFIVIVLFLLWWAWSNDVPTGMPIFLAVVFLLIFKYRQSLPELPACCYCCF